MPDNNGSDLSALLIPLLKNLDFKRKLAAYADKLLTRAAKHKFARHICPSDVVSTVIVKFLAGDIHWNSKICSLECFLYRRIRTEVYNIAKKEMKFLPVQIDQADVISDYEGEIDEDPPVLPQFIICPFEDHILNNENDLAEFEKIAYNIFKDSPEEFCVLDEIFQGNKSNLIGSNLGLSENEVHNIKKRIIRGIRKWAFKNKKLKFVNPLVLLINKNKPGKKPPENNNNGESI